MNWGGFAGGFASGFGSGVAMGKTINDTIKQNKIEEMRQKGIEEANAAREQAINSAIQEGQPVAASVGISGQQPAAQAEAPAAPKPVDPTATPAPAKVETTTPSNPAGMTTPSGTETPQTGSVAKAIAQEDVKPITPDAAKPDAQPAAPQASKGMPFTVAGKTYATREEARAAAEKVTPGVMEFMSKTLVPRMQEAYIAQGDVEKAEAWGKWAEERDNKAAMKEWAQAYRAAQLGNVEKAADHVFNLYKRYDDGITPLSKEVVKDKEGNVTGFNVKLKNDKSGEEYSQFIDRKALTEMGLAALSPPQMFELQYKRQAEADKMAAQVAADNAKSRREFGEKVALQDRKHDQDIERMTIDKQLDEAKVGTAEKRKIQAKVDALKGAGYSEEFINGVLPGIIGVGDYKKATSPEEARRLAHSDRMKSDPMYSRKSAEDQKKILDQDMNLIFGGVKPSAPAAAGGLPQAGSAPQKKGVPMYDTKTGTIVYR